MTRECGTCHECYVRVAVAALEKPAGTRCQHLKSAACGCCSIYANRPPECQQYKCSWLDGTLHDELKPDACGMLFETAKIFWPKPLTMLIGFEHEPGAADRFRPQLESSAVAGVIILIVRTDETLVTVGHAEDVATYNAFMDLCRERGAITHQYADGIVEQITNDEE